MASDVFGILGTVVAGAFQVEEVVAEGGFGVVYRAYHSGFRAPVALKCLKIPQAVAGAHATEFLEQFRAEAELLFRLSASIPAVVRPLHVDAMTAPDGSFVPFIALEWLEGETLEAVVRRRHAEGRAPIGIKKLARMLTPVARALERAHNFIGPDGPVSVVHRDLKPENIFIAMLAGEETVKIVDFGIAKAKSVASQVAGRASQSEGTLASFTPAYGAPEQWLPKRFGQTGPWTDVWGLALTMVEVMAARPIIDGDQAAMMGTALDEKRRPTPRSEGVEVSDEVERIFARALALDPRARYEDAGLFWNELSAAVGIDVNVPVIQRARRDLRAEGDAIVPRVERIEAAMSARSSTPSPMLDRMAPTLDAPAAASASPPDLSPFSRPVPVSRSGEYRAEVAPSPAAGEIPDLVAAPPLSPSAAAPAGAAAPAPPPASAAAPAVRPSLDIGHSSGSLDLDLDLAPGERPSARSSGNLRAVSPPLPAMEPTRAAATPARALARSPNFLPDRSLSGDPDTASKRFGGPAALILGGIAITIADQVFAAATGEVFTLGPLRASLIAAPLALGGVALLVWRLVSK